MKIEFENGSSIESIGSSIEGNTRSKRGNDYIKRLAQANRLFDSEDIKTLDYNDLDGKILKMVVVENEGVRIVAGQDIESRKIYVLSCENFIRESNRLYE